MANIEELKKKYKGEWLAVEIIGEENGQPVDAKLILHTTNKDKLRNEVPLQMDKTIYITYAGSSIRKDNTVTSRAKVLAEKGIIRLATGGDVEIDIPPKFPGKPLSEYLKEIRE
jgi:hypothetical protein